MLFFFLSSNCICFIVPTSDNLNTEKAKNSENLAEVKPSSAPKPNKDLYSLPKIVKINEPEKADSETKEGPLQLHESTNFLEESTLKVDGRPFSAISEQVRT